VSQPEPTLSRLRNGQGWRQPQAMVDWYRYRWYDGTMRTRCVGKVLPDERQ
jgi:hypothetical protein